MIRELARGLQLIQLPATRLLPSGLSHGDDDVGAKIVSDRIGYAHDGITVQIYGHRSTGHARQAAELVAGLIRPQLDEGPTPDAG